jgi:branched-chain amino acid aminotransferase
VLLDANGNLAEGMGSNIFVVRDGKLYTPSERYSFKASAARSRSISRESSPFQQLRVTSIFSTQRTPKRCSSRPRASASAGVRSFNGAQVGDGRAPGPITSRLIDA